MRYKIDHDYHIHTRLSLCSEDDGQTPAAILELAKRRNLKKICLTDHFWDETVPCNTMVNWWQFVSGLYGQNPKEYSVVATGDIRIFV